MSKNNNEQLDAQAVQDLLRTIASELPGNADRLTPEALHSLAERLTSVINQGDGQTSNQHGLDTQEIVEPVPDDAEEQEFKSDPLDLVPLSSLSEEERDLHRRKRDRFLDLLEAEEELERHNERKAARQEAIQKYEQLKQQQLADQQASKDMQKKMGKALLRQTANEPEKDPLPSDETTSKKRVTFADTPDEEPHSPSPPPQPTPLQSNDLGDLSFARLRPGNSKSYLRSNQPMRANVVERFPTHTTSPSLQEADSDDESEPPDPSEQDASSQDGSAQEDDVELEEGYDLDVATLQREVALEYHKKRAAMGDLATKAILNPIINDQPVDPLLNQAKNDKRPEISHFRASRMASTYNTSMQNQSLEGAVLPEESAKTLQNAIKLGSLNSEGELVGDEDDSDEEGDEAMQEMLELLRNHQIENTGPSKAESPSETEALKTPFDPIKLPPLNKKAPVSKFQVDKSRSGRPAYGNVVERSSPSTSTLASNVVESPSFRPPGAGSTLIENDTQAKKVDAVDPPKKVSRFMADRR